MPKAIWNNTVIADAPLAATRQVEGNTYFPPEAVDPAYLRPNSDHTVCPWKGTASYHDVVVGDAVAKGAAWYYPEPKAAAAEIKGYIAFWRGVKVEA